MGIGGEMMFLRLVFGALLAVVVALIVYECAKRGGREGACDVMCVEKTSRIRAGKCECKIPGVDIWSRGM